MLSPRFVNILFGSACNMRCPYCLQTNEQAPADHKADLDAFLDSLLQRVDAKNLERISYWGGEPMLYWDRIRHIHSGLTEAGFKPRRMSTITTNGRLITDEYVDYANSHEDIFTPVSTHDFAFTDKQYERIGRLKRFSFSALVHHYRTNLWELQDFYWKMQEFYGRPVMVCAHYLRCNDGCDRSFYMSREDIDEYCRHLEHELLPMARMGDEWAVMQCRQLLWERGRIRRKGPGPMCVRDEQISIDLHGNLYQCHHNYAAWNITGNLFKKTIPIRTSAAGLPDRFFKSSECQACECLDECRGGCYTSNTHELDCYFAKKRARIYKLMEKTLNAA